MEISVNHREGKITIGGQKKEGATSLEKKFQYDRAGQNIYSFREINNFAYVAGAIVFTGNCDNNVIISDYKTTELIDIKNSLVIADKESIKVYPISNLEERLLEAEGKLDGKTIKYCIPTSVSIRESLREKNIENLLEEIKKRYALTPIEVKPLRGGRSKFGVYYVKCASGEEYLLKYQGQDAKKAEVLARISNTYPEIFAKVLPRPDQEGFTFRLEDGLYGIEEFVHGSILGDRSAQFFRLIGRTIKCLHDNLRHFLIDNPSLVEYLTIESRHLSESNLVALWLDLKTSRLSHHVIREAISRLIKEKISDRVQSLPETLIHGDLNHSNLIWSGGAPRIIDKETIKISKRIMEFEIPLLFIGSTNIPEYTSKSLDFLIQGFGSTGAILEEDEIKIIPSLLEYSLIKNYVVKNIRRGLSQNRRLEVLTDNLVKIGKEKTR